MDDKIQNGNNSSPFIVLSPAYTKDEVNALINLVAKYKHIILNKCTNSATNHAKEVAWVKISKEINKQGFQHTRNVDSLKTKWENLKKEARKASKNLINLKKSDDDILYQIVEMISETEPNTNINEMPHNWLEDINDLQDDENNSSKLWDDNDHKQSDSSEGDDEEKRVVDRSLNFSPQECSLLLKCIKDEKKYIFCKESTSRAIKMKNSAWSRITYKFNKMSPQKRTTKMLRTKFNNMKNMAKQINFKNFSTKNQHEKLEEDKNKKIKCEPHFEYKDDLDSDSDEQENNDDINAISNEHFEEISDPLSTVLKGDSGIDSLSQYGGCRQSENNEVIKLKLELLKYKLETAKLERQRIIEAAQAESEERESRAIETSLRLRAARLAVAAAQLQLAPDHPALRYDAREARAQAYLQQFPHD
ncbi:unnamed protein product [Euphydryas editha]|uniref:Regulatory protein zeste n=1 Tax=Euphydryas editha TaxID=104508 RepID=A0AAU9TV20_EUPED|nr:unnamed protein product [Euphydryas editha]